MDFKKAIVLTALPNSVSLHGKNMDSITSIVKSPVSKVSILIDSKRKDFGSTDDISPAPIRKRQRLDHLTHDEKIQRRKLKNRVAAQCARDRKKEKMTQLEDEIEILKTEKQMLAQENFVLQQRNLQLEEENSELSKRLQEQTTTNDKESSKQVSKVHIKQEKDSCGSIEHASPINVSLQKEQDLQLYTLLMMRFLCLRTIASLITFLICYNSAVKNCCEKVPFLPPLELKETKSAFQNRDPGIKWWGPHQKNWNPSKNL